MTTRAAPPTRYRVYVIELDETLSRKRDCLGAGRGPPVYVG